MKKLVIAAVVVFAVALSSAVAQTCPGGVGCGSGDKEKSDKKKDGSTSQTVAPMAFEL
jgi:hypothetical protein